MSGIFSYCRNLNELNLSSFNTNIVNDMNNIFCYCENFYKLDLSLFNTNNLKHFVSMFFLAKI